MTEPAVTQPRPRYDLVELIATGGMGQVWRAEDTLLHRDVAVKVLKAEYAGDELFRTRFVQEARLAAAIQHPHVASVLDYGEREDPDGGAPRPMLVMELVEGQPLSAIIGDPALTPERAADLVAQAGEGLAAAHTRGVVHRDVKPGNLLVDPRGHVKVTDFGIARAADAASLTMTGHLVGTPHYLSPEQAEGERATPRSDVYALGVVLFECLTGTKPFESDSPVVTALRHVRDPLPPLPDHVPERMRAVVDRACAKDPAMRFADGAEMAAALRGDTPVWPEGAPPGAAATSDDPTATLAMTSGAPGAPGPPTTHLPSYAGSGRRRGAGRGRVALMVLLALLALLLLAGFVRAVRSGDDGSGTGSGTGSGAGSGADQGSDTVTVDPADYVGQPEDTASQRLQDQGLQPVSERRTNPGGEQAGTVAAVRPTGPVDRGSQVTLEVWDEPAQPGPGKGDKPDKPAKDEKDGKGKGKGKGGPVDGLPGLGEG
jgi:serine/threonine-protein kinase